MSGWTIVRRIIMTAAAVWFGLAMLLAADPVGDFAMYMVLFCLGLATGVAWLVYSIAWRGVFVSRRRAVWIAIPLVPVVAVVIGTAQWPLSARVWLSEKALREYVERGEEPGRVGTFAVSNRDRRGNAVFLTTGHSWFDVGGIAHIPTPAGVPDDVISGRISLTHLYGPWYRFVIPD